MNKRDTLRRTKNFTMMNNRRLALASRTRRGERGERRGRRVNELRE